jgi:hypothetical protein
MRQLLSPQSGLCVECFKHPADIADNVGGDDTRTFTIGDVLIRGSVQQSLYLNVTS